MQHMRDAHHELAFGLPHYMCGVTAGTVTVAMKYSYVAADWLLYILCCNEHCLKVLSKRYNLAEYARISSYS